MENSSHFRAVALNDSFERKVKRRGSTSKSLQSEIDTEVDLFKQELAERCDILINASELSGSKKLAFYDTENLVHDMLILNVDAWSSNPKDLVDFGREEIECLVKRRGTLSQKTGSVRSKQFKTSGYQWKCC